MQHAAAALDLLHQRPGLGGEILGQPLDVPAASRRVDDATQLRFLQQDQLGVAREAPGRWCGPAQCMVERQHRDAAGPAGRSRERRHRAAQDVHVRIDPREHAFGGLRVHAHGLNGRFCSGDLQHLSPQPAQRTELGQRQEEIRIGRQGKPDLARSRVGRHPCVDQGAQVGNPGGDGKRQLLRLAGAAAVIGPAIGEERHRPRPGRGNLLRKPHHACEGSCWVERAAAGHGAQWVRVQIGTQGRGIDPASFGQLQQGGGGRQAIGLGVEANGGQIHEHAGQRPIQHGSNRMTSGTAAGSRSRRSRGHR